MRTLDRVRSSAARPANSLRVVSLLDRGVAFAIAHVLAEFPFLVKML